MKRRIGNNPQNLFGTKYRFPFSRIVGDYSFGKVTALEWVSEHQFCLPLVYFLGATVPAAPYEIAIVFGSAVPRLHS